MSKKILVISALLLTVFSFAFVCFTGRTYTAVSLLPQDINPDDISVKFDNENIVALNDVTIKDGKIRLEFRSLNPGRVSVYLEGISGFSLYVHKTGVITDGTFFGNCTGGRIIPLAFALYGIVVIIYLILKYRRDTAESIYQYKNAVTLGIIIFAAFFIMNQMFSAFREGGIANQASLILRTPNSFSLFTFPLAFILSVLIVISNITLIRKEGRNLRNMLGIFLGLFLCAGIIFPFALGEFLQRTTLVDVHNENGAALYIELFVEGFISAAVAYLECILAGTVIMSVIAAKRIPDFDRDYILILGCKVGNDGKVTKLLGSRAQRAVDFARMQKEKTGRDIVFVPSGGKGSDEPVSEAQAIKDYLIESGIPEEKIILEDKSANTDENFRFSIGKIKEFSGEENPKIAFSTTNYHVFRSGMIAFKQGIDAQGIGAPTKRYFWINAFIREFVATLFSEKKKHLIMLASLTAFTVYLVLIICFNNNL